MTLSHFLIGLLGAGLLVFAALGVVNFRGLADDQYDSRQRALASYPRAIREGWTPGAIWATNIGTMGFGWLIMGFGWLAPILGPGLAWTFFAAVGLLLILLSLVGGFAASVLDARRRREQQQLTTGPRSTNPPNYPGRHHP